MFWIHIHVKGRENKMEKEEMKQTNSTTDKDEGTEKRFNKKRLALIIIIALAAVYIGFSLYFTKHYYFGTTINGMECGGKTVESLEAEITESIDGYVLNISERGEVTESIAGVSIDLTPNFENNDALNSILNGQSAFGWIVGIFGNKEYDAETVLSFDGLDEEIAALECMDETKYVAPEDAYISDYIEGTGYEIEEGDPGNQIDQTRLSETILAAVMALDEELDLDEAGVYVEAEIGAADEELIAAAEQANAYAAASVTYTFGDEDPVVVAGSEVAKFIKIDGTKVTIDEEAIDEWVDELADAHDTINSSREFTTTSGKTVTVEGGDYGWSIDTEAEAKLLKSYIKEGETIEKEPEYSQEANAYGEEDYGDTYVEINLTTQHLYFYVDGELKIESDVVTGNVSKGNNTPAGTYSVTYKEKDAVLRGDDYETPVSYWMPFNGGIGLHDATWRSTFGGSIYKTNGSHGCVNLPYSVAQTIFEYIEKGDPVILYRLPGDTTVTQYAQVEDDDEDTEDTEDTKKDKKDKKDKNKDKDKDKDKNKKDSTSDSSSKKDNSNQKAANKVINLISGIGTVTLDSGSSISSARNAYDSLTSAQKKLVTNYGTLTSAESTYQSLLDEQKAAEEEQTEEEQPSSDDTGTKTEDDSEADE